MYFEIVAAESQVTFNPIKASVPMRLNCFLLVNECMAKNIKPSVKKYKNINKFKIKIYLIGVIFSRNILKFSSVKNMLKLPLLFFIKNSLQVFASEHLPIHSTKANRSKKEYK